MAENIAVIGGGYTGAISAILLAQKKDQNSIPLYKVTLLEKKEQLFNGASKSPGRLHLGGEYPLDEETAFACLDGAITFKQMFGEGVLTDIPEVRYLVSKESQESGELTVDNVISSYSKIKKKYSESIDKISAALSEEQKSKNKKEAQQTASELLFGPPEELFSTLSKEQLEDTPGFVGGIATKERGLNPVRLGTHLETLLKKSGVNVRTGVNVDSVKKNENDYTINISKNNGKETLKTQQVINASWEGAYRLNNNSNQPDQHIHLRAIALVDISRLNSPPKYASFGLIGETGGMLSPFNDKLALFYSPTEQNAYIDSTILNNKKTTPPENWDSLQKPDDKEKRIDSYQSALENRYPKFKDAKVIDLVIRPTIAIDPELSKRRHINVFETTEGMHTAISTKATFSAMTAQQVVKSVMQRSGHQIKQSTSLLIPEEERNIATDDIDASKAKEYARKRSLPEELFRKEKEIPQHSEQIYDVVMIRTGNQKYIEDKNSTAKQRRDNVDVHYHIIRSDLLSEEKEESSQVLESAVLYQMGSIADLEKGRFYSGIDEENRAKYMGGSHVIGLASRCNPIDGILTTADEAIIINNNAYAGDINGKGSRFSKDDKFSFIQVADLSNASTISGISQVNNSNSLVDNIEQQLMLSNNQTFVAHFKAKLAPEAISRNISPTNSEGKRHETLKTMWEDWQEHKASNVEMAHLLTDKSPMTIIGDIKAIGIDQVKTMCKSKNNSEELEYRNMQELSATRKIQKWSRKILEEKKEPSQEIHV